MSVPINQAPPNSEFALCLFKCSPTIVKQEKRGTERSNCCIGQWMKNQSALNHNLLAWLLMTQFRHGATVQQLMPRMNWLRDQLNHRRLRPAFTGTTEDIIVHAANRLLREQLVSIEEPTDSSSNDGVLLRPSTELSALCHLRSYGDQIRPVFLLDSILANAIYSNLDNVVVFGFEDQYPDNPPTIYQTSIMDAAAELIDLLQFELADYIEQDLRGLLDETLTSFIDQELLGVSKRSNFSTAETNRYQWLDFEFGEDEQTNADYQQHYPTRERSIEYQLMLSHNSLDTLRLYRQALSPLIEIYWFVAISLLAMTNGPSEYEFFLERTLHSGRQKSQEGLLSYPELLTTDRIKNSLKLFQTWNVLQMATIDNGVTVLWLNRQHSKEQQLTDLIMKIEKFKK